jgi:hypothetical protein
MSIPVSARVRSLLSGRRPAPGNGDRVGTSVLVCFPEGRLQVATALRAPEAGEELKALGITPGWVVQSVGSHPGELHGSAYDLEVMVRGERRRGGLL